MAFDNTKRHIVAESSLLKATITGRLVNLVDTAAHVDNGKLVTKGDYIAPETYKMGTPAVGDKVYLTLQAPLVYENYTSGNQAEYNFYNEKGSIVRCYPLEEDDIFTVSENAITALASAPVLNNLVVSDGRDIKEVAAVTDTATYGFVGRIIQKVTLSSGVNYRIEVIKNTTV